MKNAKEKAAPAIVWEKIASCLWEGRMGGRTEFVIKLCGAAYRMCRPDFPETLTSYSGSTPKSVDFNERRRIGQGPSIDNFQSFYSRRLGVVLASSCGGSPR